MVFGSVVAGPGGAGAVPLLAGPTGASYNEIRPICVNLRLPTLRERSGRYKNGLLAPPGPVAPRFSQFFAPPDPKIRHFRHFHPPTRAPALQKQDFPAVSPFSRPLRARPVGESGPFSAGCHPELVEGSRPTHTVAPQEFRRELSTLALRACAQVDPSSPPPPIQFSHPLSILKFTARRPTCKTPPKPSCFRLENKGTTAFDPHEQNIISYDPFTNSYTVPSETND